MIYIVHSLIFSFEAYIAYQYQSSLLLKKTNLKMWYYASIYIVAYVVLLSLFLFCDFWVNTLCFFVAQCIIGMHLYRVNVLQITLLSAVQTAIMLGAELIISTWGNFAYQMSSSLSNITTYATNAISSKLLYWLIVVIMIRFAKKENSDKSIRNFGLNTFVLSLIPSCSLIMLIGIGVLLSGIDTSHTQEVMVLLCELMLICINVLIFWVYDRHLKMLTDIADLNLRLQGEEADNRYYQMLDHQNRDLRLIRHDMRNHLMAIQAFVTEGKDQSAIDYIDQMMHSKALSSGKRWCKDSLLNTIIQRKDEICREQGILFSADIRSHSTDYIRPVDIVAIFGNLLDNAITAAGDCEDKYVDLDCRYDQEKRETLIQVINTSNQPIVSGDGTHWLTTKQERDVHGLGLKSVESSVSTYNGYLKTFFQPEDHTFHALVLLKNITGGGLQNADCDM